MTIVNYNPSMKYRRFGKTQQQVSVITLGGMRYKHTWNEPRDEIAPETLDQATAVTQKALEMGINHIETAWGYGKSEHIYGKVLNERLGVPRKNYILMTKGAPQTAADVRSLVEKQLSALQTDHIDLYGYHGINTQQKFEASCAAGGPVEELLKLKQEGVIGSVGFSTHAPLETILQAIQTDLFSFVNVHYYYFLQRNAPAIHAAAQRDMGVFIISPNDKGGKLYEPSETLADFTAPRSPIAFNARFCLRTPAVHTLSFGMSELDHFRFLPEILQGDSFWQPTDLEIFNRLEKQKFTDPYSWFDGYSIAPQASDINIPEVLRFRTMWKCFDMQAWCHYRYNMFQLKDDWFPGDYCTEENVAAIDDALIPDSIPLKEMLREFHQKFYKTR